jgi:phosphoesterase RecJ-like protein|tara:strand:+ start:356 stop:1339 length:984 start_codon:yes stop_codon:yes gene_type:complete
LSAFFPELTPLFKEFVNANTERKVCVIGHARPDGDCIGSQIALSGMLKMSGVDVLAVNADRIPEALNYLDGSSDIEMINPSSLGDLPLVYVDCADEFRVGPKTSEALASRRRILNIDHHITNTLYAEMNLIDADASATCEILAGIALDVDLDIGASIAQAMYAGIVTDTGRFSYAATSSRVFELCSELVKRGASPQIATQNLFENESLARMKLLERFLASLALECDGKVCVGQLRQRDFLETGTSYQDTEGFVDYARTIKGVSVGVLLEERKTETKSSLRANRKELRVDQIASLFGGGGHACAAAMTIKKPLDELRAALLEALAKRV